MFLQADPCLPPAAKAIDKLNSNKSINNFCTGKKMDLIKYVKC